MVTTSKLRTKTQRRHKISAQLQNKKRMTSYTSAMPRTVGPWNCQATVDRPQCAENSTSEPQTERNSLCRLHAATVYSICMYRVSWPLVQTAERLLLEYRQERWGYGTTSELCCRLAVVEEISTQSRQLMCAGSCGTWIGLRFAQSDI